MALSGWFQLTATVTDANGNPVADSTEVSWVVWEETADVVLVRGGGTLSTQSGRSYGLFLVVAADGVGHVRVTSGTVSGTKVLAVDPPSVQPPPAPVSVSLAAPFDLRRTAGQFTVHAVVTDANGAPVPDGTPISWEMIGALSQSSQFTAVSEERTTTNGAASATYQVSIPMGDSVATVLAIASVGDVSGALYFATGRTLPQPPNPATVTLTSDKPEWTLLKIGDIVTITATVLDANDAAVADGTAVTWFALPLDSPTEFELVMSDTVTSSGSASATYRVAGRGTVVRGVAGDALGVIVFSRNIGAWPEPPPDLALSIRLPADSDNVVPTDSTLQVAVVLTHSGEGETVYVSGGLLRIAGVQEWESGRNALPVPGQTVRTFHTVSSSLALDTCNGVSIDGQTDWTCIVKLESATIHIPAGTPSGTFTISGAITVNGREYTDTLEVTVVAPGSIDEVAEAQFDFAERERGPNRGEPYPANVPVGGVTKFRLKALNENGAASAEGAIGSILITTTIGALSANIGGGCVGGATTCSIPVSAITAANADKIDITLTHADRANAGRGQVRATVITTDGETFTPPPLTVTLAGAAASLAISEPRAALLNSATESDDRDLLKLTVTAADAEGNNVDVPYRAPRVAITDADGRLTTSGISVMWTEDSDDRDDAHDQFTRNSANAVEATISVTADAESPLDTGEYTIELRTAGITTARKFSVVGPPASVALGEPQGSFEINGTVTFTAAVRDAAGAPVPDGTPVSWSARSTTESTILVQLSADTATQDGAASATYLSVGSGTAIITAESGNVRDVRLTAIGGASIAGSSATGGAAAPPPDPSESLSNSGAGGYAAWLGEQMTSASALLDGLPETESIQLWQNGRWLRYSRDGGRIIPGSIDFTIRPGDVLFLGP